MTVAVAVCTCVTEIRADVLASNEAFFDALLAADPTALADMLTDEFGERITDCHIRPEPGPWWA
jgi:hypothetical protein